MKYKDMTQAQKDAYNKAHKAHRAKWLERKKAGLVGTKRGKRGLAGPVAEPRKENFSMRSEGKRVLFVHTDRKIAEKFMNNPEKKRLFNKMELEKKGREFRVVSDAGQWNWEEVQRQTYPARKGPSLNILSFEHAPKHDI